MNREEIQKIVTKTSESVKTKIETQAIESLLDLFNVDKNKYFEDEYLKNINLEPVLNFLECLYYTNSKELSEDEAADALNSNEVFFEGKKSLSDIIEILRTYEISWDKEKETE
mgnify:CR=1 FL=1